MFEFLKDIKELEDVESVEKIRPTPPLPVPTSDMPKDTAEK